MTMTRRDYTAMADMLANLHRNAEAYPEAYPRAVAHGMLNVVTTSLADILAADNPRFDRERFLRAASGYPTSDAKDK